MYCVYADCGEPVGVAAVFAGGGGWGEVLSTAWGCDHRGGVWRVDVRAGGGCGSKDGGGSTVAEVCAGDGEEEEKDVEKSLKFKVHS